jgi:hypothetical protein
MANKMLSTNQALEMCLLNVCEFIFFNSRGIMRNLIDREELCVLSQQEKKFSSSKATVKSYDEQWRSAFNLNDRKSDNWNDTEDTTKPQWRCTSCTRKKEEESRNEALPICTLNGFRINEIEVQEDLKIKSSECGPSDCTSNWSRF